MISNISLVGLGYMGKAHLRQLMENPNWKVAGVYDINQNLTRDLAQQYGVTAFSSFEQALEAAPVVDITTPGSTHTALVREAIVSGKHVFVEQLVSSTLKEARTLQKLVGEAGVILQVGRIERFNPAFKASLPYIQRPVFIEVHRLTPYQSRGTDVSVVMDLMMHDIDLLLSLVKSNVKKIHVSGSPLVSEKADIVNARIEFENGTVANMTTNRLAFKASRKFRVFTQDNFVSINLLDKTTEVIKIRNAGKGTKNMVLEPAGNGQKKEVVFEHPIILPTNAINEELNSFHLSVNSNKASQHGIDDAIRTLEVALEIEEKLDR